MSRKGGLPVSPEAIDQAWRHALDLWGVGVNLSPPVAYQVEEKGHFDDMEPLAYIDMSTRQVVVNYALLERIGALASLPAVLAHEVGHHARFPHTLGLAAALRVMEQTLIPGIFQSLTNLFFDLQVNEVVGRTRKEELVAVYKGFVSKEQTQPHWLFTVYLAVYEELWGLEVGTIVPAEHEQAIELRFPGFRGDARMFAQTFYALDDVYLQFAYFCSIFVRYLDVPSTFTCRAPLAADVREPDADDYAGALYGSGAMERALAEAKERGWVEDGEAPGEEDALTTIERVTAGLPGSARGPFRRALVGHHYRRLVDAHMIELPTATPGPTPDPYLPTTTTEWEVGDDPRSIDWTQSVLASGALAGVMPLRRELLPEDPVAVGVGVPAVEIYLDTSGSMPNPASALNAMTLASQILSAAAIRKGGKVRAVVYSSGTPLVSDWMQDEDTARDFLLHYVGGGTDYPFAVLKQLAGERDDVIRVVISDSDFLSNVKGKGAHDALLLGVERSLRFIVLLALPWGSEVGASNELEVELLCPEFRLAVVKSYGDLVPVAAQLSQALFGER